MNILSFLAGALSMLQDPSTAEILLKQLKDPDAAVRIVAARKIGEAGTKSHGPLLLPLLEDEDGRVRWIAAEAIRALDGRYLEGDINKLLDHRNPGIRADAVFALSAIGSRAAVREVGLLLKDS